MKIQGWRWNEDLTSLYRRAHHQGASILAIRDSRRGVYLDESVACVASPAIVYAVRRTSNNHQTPDKHPTKKALTAPRREEQVKSKGKYTIKVRFCILTLYCESIVFLDLSNPNLLCASRCAGLQGSNTSCSTCAGYDSVDSFTLYSVVFIRIETLA